MAEKEKYLTSHSVPNALLETALQEYEDLKEKTLSQWVLVPLRFGISQRLR